MAEFASPSQEEPKETTILELFANFAENEEVVTETKKLLSSIFSNIQDRGELEDIWEFNDKMYRVKPDPAKDDIHRANEATGVFHISIFLSCASCLISFLPKPASSKGDFIPDFCATSRPGR